MVTPGSARTTTRGLAEDVRGLTTGRPDTEAKTQGALEGFLGWMGVMARMEAVIQQAIAGIPGQMIETQGTTDKIQEAIKGVSGRMAEMDTTAYTIMADLLAGMKVQGMAQIQGPGRTTAAMTPMATTSGLLPGEGKKKEFEGRAQPSASRCPPSPLRTQMTLATRPARTSGRSKFGRGLQGCLQVSLGWFYTSIFKGKPGLLPKNYQCPG